MSDKQQPGKIPKNNSSDSVSSLSSGGVQDKWLKNKSQLPLTLPLPLPQEEEKPILSRQQQRKPNSVRFGDEDFDQFSLKKFESVTSSVVQGIQARINNEKKTSTKQDKTSTKQDKIKKSPGHMNLKKLSLQSQKQQSQKRQSQKQQSQKQQSQKQKSQKRQSQKLQVDSQISSDGSNHPIFSNQDNSDSTNRIRNVLQKQKQKQKQKRQR